MKSLNVKRLTVISLTASIYIVLTLMFKPLSYGAIQIRFSEILNLLCFINPVFAPGVVLGCFIANTQSDLGPIDMIVGTFATFCACISITKIKSLFVASLMPTLFCIFIGLEITFLSGEPFSFITFISISASIMAGEFIAVSIIGYLIMKIMMKNESLMKIFKNI